MNKKQLAMGLFALGTSALPVTDKIIKEAGIRKGHRSPLRHMLLPVFIQETITCRPVVRL